MNLLIGSLSSVLLLLHLNPADMWLHSIIRSDPCTDQQSKLILFFVVLLNVAISGVVLDMPITYVLVLDSDILSQCISFAR